MFPGPNGTWGDRFGAGCKVKQARVQRAHRRGKAGRSLSGQDPYRGWLLCALLEGNPTRGKLTNPVNSGQGTTWGTHQGESFPCAEGWRLRLEITILSRTLKFS